MATKKQAAPRLKAGGFARVNETDTIKLSAKNELVKITGINSILATVETRSGNLICVYRSELTPTKETWDTVKKETKRTIFKCDLGKIVQVKNENGVWWRTVANNGEKLSTCEVLSSKDNFQNNLTTTALIMAAYVKENKVRRVKG